MPNILVVEDSPTVRKLIAFALKRLFRHAITEASDGVYDLKKTRLICSILSLQI
jgi:two-component system chemotaxis response regulator CheY